MCAHPLPFPNTSFTRELFFCRERSFEKEKQHGTIDDNAIASETKLTLADWGDHAQSIETGFFFHFTNGGLGQVLPCFASTFWKGPTLIRIFNEENLNVSTAF